MNMSFMKFRVELEPPNSLHNCGKAGPHVLQTCGELSGHPSLAYLWTMEQQQPQSPHQITNATVAPDSEADGNPTAAYLRSLARSMLVVLCNEKDLSSPLLKKHIASSFSTKQDDHLNSKGRDDLLALWADTVKLMPDYHAEIIDSVAEIHETGKKAKVWTFKRLSGLPGANMPGSRPRRSEVEGGICKEGVTCMHWELRAQVWQCVRLKMMRGVSEFE